LLKKELRKQILAKRGQIPSEIRQVKSKLIVERLVQLPVYQQAQALFTFVPFGHEVDIRPLIDQAIMDGKVVAVPYTDTIRKEMTIYLFEGWEQLISGVYGILEPVPAHAKKILPGQLDLIIVPGVAFDQSGGRLGYGGGFYDRFLTNYYTANCPPLVAPCFSEQMTDQIPLEKHDFRVNLVINDMEIVNCRK